jgi:chromosome segregation ATPase
MTARVLESGTSYATALYLNIKHFDRAIAAEARIAQIEQNQADLQAKNMSFEQQMQSIILEMKEEIRVLRNENTAMKAEINVLREENTALKEEIGILRKENAYLKEKLTKSDWPAGAAGEGTA